MLDRPSSRPNFHSRDRRCVIFSVFYTCILSCICLLERTIVLPISPPAVFDLLPPPYRSFYHGPFPYHTCTVTEYMHCNGYMYSDLLPYRTYTTDLYPLPYFHSLLTICPTGPKLSLRPIFIRFLDFVVVPLALRWCLRHSWLNLLQTNEHETHRRTVSHPPPSFPFTHLPLGCLQYPLKSNYPPPPNFTPTSSSNLLYNSLAWPP